MTALADELTQSDESYFDWSRVWARSIEGGQMTETGGALLVVTGAPQEWWNIAFITRPLDDPERALREIVAFFEERKQPFIMRIRDGLDPAAERAAEAAGFEYTDTMPGMVLAPIPDAPPPAAGLDIRHVTDGAALAGVVRVIAEAYEMEPRLTAQLTPVRLIEHPMWESYVGYVGGEPAATSALLQTNDIAGITFVGTREAFRKRGFGEAVTWHAVRRGMERGCRLAALQASRMGYPIYERMGFRHVTGYKTYVLPQHRS